MITQGQVSYVFRGKEMTFDFYPVQPLERLGLSMRGERKVIGDGYRFTFTLTPSEDIILKSVSVEMALDLSHHSRIFANGFQSWTESREYDLREKMPRLRWPLTLGGALVGERALRCFPSARGLFHSWTYSYVRGSDGNIVLFGSVSERQGYTLFELDAATGSLRVSRDCDGLKIGETYTALDIVVLPGREEEVFQAYFQEISPLGDRTGRFAPVPVSGWFGSRDYLGDISEPVVLASLAEIKKRDIPLDYFLIGDGWQSETGDWLRPSSQFPRGMKKIAAAIKEAGYKPGLWIAPYILSRWSEAFRRNRDWLLKDENGRPMRAGWNRKWGGNFYALDVYNPDFRNYLAEVFGTALEDWGFEMVMADFLYAAALRPRERKTRGQVMSDAVGLVRELLRDKVVLAGGVPLGAAFHNVDYCLMGSVASLRWEDSLKRALGYRERPSASNALTSMISRYRLNGKAFAAGGNAMSMSSQTHNMTFDQVKTLLRLNLLFSETFFVSDNPAGYSAAELIEYRSAFPVKAKKILSVRSRRGAWTVSFEIEGRQYVLLANLTSKAREFRVDPCLYFDPSLPGFRKYEVVGDLAPYESRCLLRVPSQDWAVAGGTGHVFPGCEVLDPSFEEGAVKLDLHPHAKYESEVFLRVPDRMDSCLVNGQRLKTEKVHGLTFVRLSLGPEEDRLLVNEPSLRGRKAGSCDVLLKPLQNFQGAHVFSVESTTRP
ncbi:MAG: glycoside hydrolase family 36 protein [Bacillota bacterium]|jgi:alpha-galactosidase